MFTEGSYLNMSSLVTANVVRTHFKSSMDPDDRAAAGIKQPLRHLKMPLCARKCEGSKEIIAEYLLEGK
ncbi:hypothetical protein Pelo_19013 [Pelomyxa schiedti]|nr:hypothetical protein Pelo_19013 [Pelomyxa schiedti]